MRSSTNIVTDRPKGTEVGKSDFSYAFALGAGLGLVTTILFNLFPGWFQEKGYTFLNLSGDYLVAAVLGVVALLSLPMSRFSESRSVYLTIMLSIIATFVLVAAIYLFENQVVLTILLVLFAAFYAMMSVSFLPLALSVVKDRQKVFGVGVFFAGFELPNGILEAILVAQGSF